MEEKYTDDSENKESFIELCMNNFFSLRELFAEALFPKKITDYNKEGANDEQ